MEREPHQKTKDTRPASAEVALDRFCTLTEIDLTLEQLMDPGSHLGLSGSEAQLILRHIREYHRDEEIQFNLRTEYEFSSKSERNLPKVLEILREIPDHVAAEDLFYYPIEELQPTMQIRPGEAATSFCNFCCQVLEKVEDYLQLRRKRIAKQLIDSGPTVDHALRRLIAKLLTIRKKGARGPVPEAVLFKKSPVFGLDEVKPFHQDCWDRDIDDVLEEVWHQRKAGNTRYQVFLTYAEVGFLLRAACIVAPDSEDDITSFGREVKKKLRRQWNAFVEKKLADSERA